MDKSRSQVDLIREAFHYRSRYEGSTMVFKIDYPVTLDPHFPSLVKDLALLSQTGFKIVIIPGAKEWIDTILENNNIELRYNGSLRISTSNAMPFIEMAAYHCAVPYMTGFSSSTVDALIGNFFRARGLGIIDGVDMEHTGAVDKFYLDSIRKILDPGMIPIIPCVSWNSSGKPYNVSSDEISCQAAIKLKAEKLFIVSLSGGINKNIHKIPDGIFSDENGRVSMLRPQDARKILELNKGETKSMREVEMALKALEAGVERVHIINGGEEGSILKELFSNLGAGTMIHTDEYESIREAKNRDITEILRLMEPLMQQGILLRRNAEDIKSKKEDYAVFEIDSQIRACGALHTWDDEQAEIAAIATDPAYTEMGLGSRMVNYLIGRAKKKKCKRVFALTTRSHDWFESLGFKECGIESLPEKKRLLYDHNRKSKIFALDLEN